MAVRNTHLLSIVLLVSMGTTTPAASRAAAVDIAYLAWIGGFWQVWVMDEKGNNRKQITRTESDKTRVSWFPEDGRLLVNDNDGRVLEIDATIGRETVIPLEQTPVLDAVVSPDGRQIAYSFSTAIDGNDLWVANRDGSGVHKLVKQAALQHEPAWSPDGAYLYFLSGDGGQAHDIWRVRLADQATEQLTVGELYHFDIAVARNGTLAYSSNRDGNYELYLQALGEMPQRSPERLTNDAALDARPCFSPNGRALVFESTRSGTPQIWIMDLRTKGAQQLTKHELGARAPAWRTTTERPP